MKTRSRESKYRSCEDPLRTRPSQYQHCTNSIISISCASASTLHGFDHLNPRTLFSKYCSFSNYRSSALHEHDSLDVTNLCIIVFMQCRSSESTNSILQVLLILQLSLICVARTSQYTNSFLNIAHSLVCIARIYAVHEHDQPHITNYVCIRVM